MTDTPLALFDDAPPSVAPAADPSTSIGLVLDLFAGHGWGVACQQLGLEEVGCENNTDVKITRAANGMLNLYDDAWEGMVPGALAEMLEGRTYDLLIGSPPCQTFSAAGLGSGRRNLDVVLGAIADGAYRSLATLRTLEAQTDDPRTALTLLPLAYAYRDRPRLVILEQVPPVAPVWAACGEALAAVGYSTWSGVLAAEQYGVAQTRKRAILIARLDGIPATPPPPTHSAYYPSSPSRLDPGVPRWRTMQDQLGWGMTERPYPTVSAGTAAGGQDPAMVGGSGARAALKRELDEGRWVLRSNYGTSGDPKNRGIRTSDQPAPTVTGKVDRNRLVTAKGETSLSVVDAALLQSYPADFVWPCKRTSSYQQIGNAVPPRLAQAILEHVGS